MSAVRLVRRRPRGARRAARAARAAPGVVGERALHDEGPRRSRVDLAAVHLRDRPLRDARGTASRARRARALVAGSGRRAARRGRGVPRSSRRRCSRRKQSSSAQPARPRGQRLYGPCAMRAVWTLPARLACARGPAKPGRRGSARLTVPVLTVVIWPKTPNTCGTDQRMMRSHGPNDMRTHGRPVFNGPQDARSSRTGNRARTCLITASTACWLSGSWVFQIPIKQNEGRSSV